VVRPILILVAASLIGCATGGAGEKAAPASAAESTTASSAPSSGGGPEVVHTAKTYRIPHKDAVAHYAKGAKCGGSDSPASLIGEPDQKNEMQIGKDRVITYGFRFPEGTLLIRCRADHVEVARTLK
jgi:hypothetical protein